MAHANARLWRRRRRHAWRGVRRRLRELIGDRIRFGGRRNLEVVAATTQIDYPIVMRILEDTDEHPVVQALAVAAEEIARLRANIARADR